MSDLQTLFYSPFTGTLRETKNGKDEIPDYRRDRCDGRANPFWQVFVAKSLCQFAARESELGHPRSDQSSNGQIGFHFVHPRDPAFRRVDRDFVFLMNSHIVEPGNYVPKVSEMTNFNMWTCFHTPEKGHDHDPGIPECCHPDDPGEGYQDGIS